MSDQTLQARDKSNNQPENQKIEKWKIIVPSLAPLVVVLIPLIWNLIFSEKTPQFSINPPIIDSDEDLIITANNREARKKKQLDIEFDGLLYTDIGKRNEEGNKYSWSFNFRFLNLPDSFLCKGDHYIRAGFEGGLLSNRLRLYFTKAIVFEDHNTAFPHTTSSSEFLRGTELLNSDEYSQPIIQKFSNSNFSQTKFDSIVDIESALFQDPADFSQTQFLNKFNISYATFDSVVNFSLAKFDSNAVFHSTSFKGDAIFRSVQFGQQANFENTFFERGLDLRGAKFKGLSLKNSTFNGDLILGSQTVQKYDLTETVFLGDSKIVLYDIVDLKIHLEQFHRLKVASGLDYYSKKGIVNFLKSETYALDDKARFELDYLFSKSTMYQPISHIYSSFKLTDINKVIYNYIYYTTMGLGYRPFRLAFWLLGLILIYSIFYFFNMSYSINKYISIYHSSPKAPSNQRRKSKSFSSLSDSFINCLYFSFIVLFSLKPSVAFLDLFSSQEKRIIITEWLMGVNILIAFLTLSRAGSIIGNLC